MLRLEDLKTGLALVGLEPVDARLDLGECARGDADHPGENLLTDAAIQSQICYLAPKVHPVSARLVTDPSKRNIGRDNRRSDPFH